MIHAPDIGALRLQLGLDSECVAVNAATWGPLCRAAVEQMAAFTRDSVARARNWHSHVERILETLSVTRATMAATLGAKRQEVALCESTTVGINIVLWGMALSPGDEVVYSDWENPAAVIALWNFARQRGVVLRCAQLSKTDQTPVSAFEAHINSRTRLFVVSDVNYVTGARTDLTGLSQLARSNEIFVLADGAQALGAVPIDVNELGVNAYAVSCHKFACGPDGAGALFIREDSQHRVSPVFAGVCSTTLLTAKAPTAPSEGFQLLDTAERYEVSTRSIEAYVGGAGALRWLSDEVGLQFAFARTRILRQALREKLEALDNVAVVSPKTAGGGSLTFRPLSMPAKVVVERLEAAHIHSRCIEATSPNSVRLSVGFWNRDEDIDVIASCVQHLLEGSRCVVSPCRLNSVSQITGR